MGLRVIEIIPSTIQGEGTYTGAACQFIRLTGCNSHCKWCDTKESWNSESGKLMSEQEIANSLSDINIVCITGGDPLLQDCRDLISLLKRRGYQVHIELHSLGEVVTCKPELKAVCLSQEEIERPDPIKEKITVAPLWLKMVDHITFSPKQHLRYSEDYYRELEYSGMNISLKIVVFPEESSFEFADEWVRISRLECFRGNIFLQCACDSNNEIISPERVAEIFIAKGYPSNVRLSCQMHKIIKFK